MLIFILKGSSIWGNDVCLHQLEMVLVRALCVVQTLNALLSKGYKGFSIKP